MADILTPEDVEALGELAESVHEAVRAEHPGETPAPASEWAHAIERGHKIAAWSEAAVAFAAGLMRELATLRAEVARLTAERDAAVEAEREACAAIADVGASKAQALCARHETNAAAETWRQAAKRIRARGKGPAK